MTTPEEYVESKKRYAWKSIQQLDVMHSELASLYITQSSDTRRVKLLWDRIENLETELLLNGVSYEQYTQGQ